MIVKKEKINILEFCKSCFKDLFFIISAFHFKLGLTVIIEDYIHNSIVKKYLIVIISTITLLIASLSLGLCVYKNLGG